MRDDFSDHATCLALAINDGTRSMCRAPIGLVPHPMPLAPDRHRRHRDVVEFKLIDFDRVCNHFFARSSSFLLM